MLPYDRLWEQIFKIHSFEVPFGMGKRKDEISLEGEIMPVLDDYNLNSLEHANGIAELMDGFGNVIDFSYRFKESTSIERNWNKDDGTRQLYKILNDTLGLRFVLQTNKEELILIAEKFIETCPLQDNIARQLEHNRDGYQGIHIYIRNGTKVFPIEVQLWTRRDALLNRYLRDTIYTRVEDQPIIQHARDLREWLEVIPMLDRDFGIQSYVDYMYEKAFN